MVDHAEQVHKVMEQSRFEKTLDNYYFGSSDIGCIDRASSWSYADQNLSADWSKSIRDGGWIDMEPTTRQLQNYFISWWVARCHYCLV